MASDNRAQNTTPLFAPETLFKNVVSLQPLSSDANSTDKYEPEPYQLLQQWAKLFELPRDTDQKYRAGIARLTGGMSPASLYLAYSDWFVHLASQPQKIQSLGRDAWEKYARLIRYIGQQASGQDCTPCIECEEKDDRFEGSEWQAWPFNLWAQSFLLTQDWWYRATSDVHGISKHHENVTQFVTKQFLDMCSPSNFPLTNPKILKVTTEQCGMNIVRGAQNYLEDLRRHLNNELPRGTEQFEIGKDLASSDGKVVYRNEVMELIQYSPKTEQVYPEPVLITPAWIMKYYILDLSPHNSMINYLLESGHTVFIISWKNPDRSDADLSMDDYRSKGVMAALDAVNAIVPGRKVHGVGYCLGGTLATIAAADMARQKQAKLQSLTLFCAQVDFDEAGELMLFVDESELAFLEDLMHEQGYLKKEQLSGAFNMLRSKDMIWSRIVEEYLKGEDEVMFDLLAWNVDSTRLPPKMHSEYLRDLYLNNDLADNRYHVGDHVVSIKDIDVPIFSVATQKDHIAPWQSVYKIHDLTDTDLTFLLTSGGHNAGVVSEPGHKGRQYQVKTHRPDDPYQSPKRWREEVPLREGSWWPEWQAWLVTQSGKPTQPPTMGAPDRGYRVLDDAPGRYVYQK